MFRISNTLGITEERNKILFELTSKVITISLLTTLKMQEFALDSKNNKFLCKVDEEAYIGYVAKKREHLFTILEDNTVYFTPDLFEELLIYEALTYEIQRKKPRAELKSLVIKELGDMGFKEWKKLLKEYCKELYYCEFDNEGEIDAGKLKQLQNRRYRQLYNMCLEPQLSLKDEDSENCGLIFWDYDFSFFYEKGFIDTIDMWSKIGVVRGYNIDYINDMLVTGGFSSITN